MNRTVPRPIVRYHGGKWMLAPWIISHFPKHKIYTECFGGGASVLLRKRRSYAEVYNDLDNEIVNVFKTMQTHGEELRRKIYLTPFSRKEFLDSYQETTDPIEQARRTILRSFMGFGSNAIAQKTGFRANSHRSGRHPAMDWNNYPIIIESFIERLKGVVIENRDAFDLLKQHDSEETLHYVDPPYVHSSRSGCVGYKYEMSDEEHTNLASHLNSLSGMIVLSGYKNDLYEELFTNWTRIDKSTYADGAKERIESIWLNEKCQENQLNQSLF